VHNNIVHESLAAGLIYFFIYLFLYSFIYLLYIIREKYVKWNVFLKTGCTLKFYKNFWMKLSDVWESMSHGWKLNKFLTLMKWDAWLGESKMKKVIV
jgi:hypothetical protein